MEQIRILVLCSGNSIRSQIGEGFFRALGDKSVNVESAGAQATYIHPLTIQTMQDRSIDLSEQYSKDFRDLTGQHFDYIFTLSEVAREFSSQLNCSHEVIHWDIPDPTQQVKSTHNMKREFDKVRDIVEKKAKQFLIEKSLLQKDTAE